MAIRRLFFRRPWCVTRPSEKFPVLMSDDLSNLINTRIYLVVTFEDVERYNGYLDGIERVLEQASHLVVA